jgi:hypothetical protein
VIKPRNLPDANRLSVLTATILLAYALARFIQLPGREISLEVLGVVLAVQVNIQTLVALLVAGLTASGADWLLRDHPGLGKDSTLEHWLLPAMTAWVIGFPLFQTPLSPIWWIGFSLGGALLILVLVAEYIAVDPEDVRQPAAAAGLIAVSFALFMALSISLRFGRVRLFLFLPGIILAAFLVCLRALHLRLHGEWAPLEAGLVAFAVGQFSAALYYWPISPISFGLALLGPTYGLSSLFAGLKEGEPFHRAIGEPLVVLALVWAAALIFH